MKFYTILFNRYGSFSVSAIALRFDMKLGRKGDYVGWLTREQIDELRNGGFWHEVIY